MNVTLLGTGLMGTPMGERILLAGHRLTVYNRTAAKMKVLKDKGAYAVLHAKEACQSSEVIILMLADARAIEDVLWEKENINFKGRTLIQMGTILPSESIELQKKFYTAGGEYLECPVLGSKKEAMEGKLTLMAGATPEKFNKWKDFLCVFGPDPRLIGEVGKAAALKLALNQLIASHAVAFATSLGLVLKNQIDVKVFVDILRTSSLFAPMFDKKLPLWLNGDYSNPNFPVKHLLKDVMLMLQEAKDKNLSLLVLEAISRILQKTVDEGLGEQDYSSLFKIICKDKS